jgi:hypothetical protein
MQMYRFFQIYLSLRLEVHREQRFEIDALAKPNQQLNTESCVVNGNKYCEA